VQVLDKQRFITEASAGASYMSKETRTLDQFVKYKKLKRKFGIDSVHKLSEMQDFYKLYDIMRFEQSNIK